MPWLLLQPLIMTSSPPTPSPPAAHSCAHSPMLSCRDLVPQLAQTAQCTNTSPSPVWAPQTWPPRFILQLSFQGYLEKNDTGLGECCLAENRAVFCVQSCLHCGSPTDTAEANGSWRQDPARAAVCPRRGACGVHRGNCSVFWDFQVPESHLIPSKAARLRPLWKSLGRHMHVPYLRCSFVYSFINSFKGYLFTTYGSQVQAK